MDEDFYYQSKFKSNLFEMLNLKRVDPKKLRGLIIVAGINEIKGKKPYLLAGQDAEEIISFAGTEVIDQADRYIRKAEADFLVYRRRNMIKQFFYLGFGNCVGNVDSLVREGRDVDVYPLAADDEANFFMMGKNISAHYFFLYTLQEMFKHPDENSKWTHVPEQEINDKLFDFTMQLHLHQHNPVTKKNITNNLRIFVDDQRLSANVRDLVNLSSDIYENGSGIEVQCHIIQAVMHDDLREANRLQQAYQALEI